MSQFKELLVFGDSKFLDSVKAKKFIGPLEGNADSATKDSLGNIIVDTYVTKTTFNAAKEKLDTIEENLDWTKNSNSGQ